MGDRKGEDKSGKSVGATVATVAIIRHLCRAERHLRLMDVADPLALNRSTALNILRTLVGQGLVAFDTSAKSYRITEEIGALAEAAGYGDGNIQQTIQAKMKAIADRHNVNAAFWMVDADRLILKAMAESPSDVRITQRTGQRVPLLQGAVGRAVAAGSGWSDSEIASRFAEIQFRTPQDLQSLLADVHKARKRGWSDDGGASPPGIDAIAVPVVDAGGVVLGACAVLMLSGQNDRRNETAIAEDLMKTFAG